MKQFLERWWRNYFSDEEAVYLVVLLVGAVFLLLLIGPVLAPFIAAGVFAYILEGPVQLLERRGLRTSYAVWLVYLLFLLSIIAIFFGLLPMVWQQAVSVVVKLPGVLLTLQEQLQAFAASYPGWLPADVLHQFSNRMVEEAGRWGQGALSFSLDSISNLFSLALFLFLVPLLVFFFLKDRKPMARFFGRFLPTKTQTLRRLWREMDMQLANYIRGKGLEIVIVGVVTYVAFALLGLKYKALLSLLVGLSVVIPYVGAVVVTVPVMLVAYVQFGFGDQFLLIFLVYLIVQALDGNLLVPILFSETVNLHPVAIIFAILFFGFLWGIWGVFFAIPLATLVKALIDVWPTLDNAYPAD